MWWTTKQTVAMLTQVATTAVLFPIPTLLYLSTHIMHIAAQASNPLDHSYPDIAPELFSLI